MEPSFSQTPPQQPPLETPSFAQNGSLLFSEKSVMPSTTAYDGIGVKTETPSENNVEKNLHTQESISEVVMSQVGNDFYFTVATETTTESEQPAPQETTNELPVIESAPVGGLENTQEETRGWKGGVLRVRQVARKVFAPVVLGVAALSATVPQNAEASDAYGAKAMLKNMATDFANKALIDNRIPVQLGSKNNQPTVTYAPEMIPPPKLIVEARSEAVQVLDSIGLAYNATPFYIANRNDPSDPPVRIIGQNITLHIAVTKAGETAVYVDVVYLKNIGNNQKVKILQRILVGKGTNGKIVTATLAEQTL